MKNQFLFWVSIGFMILTLVTGLLWVASSATPTNQPQSSTSWNWLMLGGVILVVFGGYLLYAKNNLGNRLLFWGVLLIVLSISIDWVGQENINKLGQRVGSYVGSIGENGATVSQSRSPCGPGKYDEGIIESTTVPLRLTRSFPCSPNLYADVGVPILVRYNGKGKWQLWDVTEGSSPPVARGTVEYVEVLLVHPGKSSRVTLRYGW